MLFTRGVKKQIQLRNVIVCEVDILNGDNVHSYYDCVSLNSVTKMEYEEIYCVRLHDDCILGLCVSEEPHSVCNEERCKEDEESDGKPRYGALKPHEGTEN